MGVILFIIAYILLLPLTIFNALNLRKKGYFKETAINIDRFGNREFRFSLNKYLIIEDSIDKFGDIRETISSVLGKNQRDSKLVNLNNFKLYYFWKRFVIIELNNYSNLTRFGNFICNTLDTSDREHCKKSIKNF